MADAVVYPIEKINCPLCGGEPAPGFTPWFQQIVVGGEKTTKIEVQAEVRNPGTGEETRFVLDILFGCDTGEKKTNQRCC